MSKNNLSSLGLSTILQINVHILKVRRVCVVGKIYYVRRICL